MSRARAKKDRIRNEAYPTPPWVLRRYLDKVKLRRGHWWEPAVGSGVLCRTAMAHPGGEGVIWHGTDITAQEAPRSLLRERYAVASVQEAHATWGDGLTSPAPWRADADKRFTGILTNPPFSLAEEFLKIGLVTADEVVLLLPLKWLESRKRAFLDTMCPDVYVIPDRCSFTGVGTDVTAYAWMRWDSFNLKATGSLTRLGTTDLAERNEGKALAREKITPGEGHASGT